jgi:hypothetical protein
MRILGLVLLIGGFLVRVLTQSASMDTLAWVLIFADSNCRTEKGNPKVGIISNHLYNTQDLLRISIYQILALLNPSRDLTLNLTESEME